MTAYRATTLDGGSHAASHVKPPFNVERRRITLSPAPAPAVAPAELEPGQLQLRAVVPHVRLGTDDSGGSTRTITGTITVYETPSSTQGIVIHEGSLEARQPLTRVKLLRDHDTRDPVGYMTSLTPDGLTAEFYVPEGGNGDRALQEASDHLRDGLSIGFAVKQYAFDDDFNLHVYEAELYEVSLCAIPDMADAGVTDVAMAATDSERNLPMNEQQLRAALAAGTITQAVFDRELARLSAGDPQPAPAPSTPPAPAPANPPHTAPQGVPEELRAGPTQPGSSSPFGHIRDRGQSLGAVQQRLQSAWEQPVGDRVSNLRLALADILPAADAGTGYFGREDWLGELWTASEYPRRWIDAIGAPQALTSWKTAGWRWVQKPTPDEWPADKTELPTSPASTERAEWEAQSWAGGWDIDRRFVDLGDSSFLEAFFAAAVTQYKAVSDASIRDDVVAAATAKTGTVTAGGVIAVLKQIIRDGRAVPGSGINRVFLGSTLYEELEDLDISNAGSLPLWLKDATVGLSLAEGSASVGTLAIQLDTALPVRQVVAFDNRALVVREKAPFRVDAIDLGKGGIDLALHAYGLLEVHDPRVVIKRTYVPAA